MFIVSGENKNIDLEIKILDGLERISELFRIQLWRESLNYGLNPTQSIILLSLLRHNTLILKDLENLTSLDKTTLSKSIKNLIEKNIIKKSRTSKDKRKIFLHLTKKGETIANQIKDFYLIFLPFIQILNEDQKKEIYFFIYKLIDYSLQKNIILEQKMCSNCKFFFVDDQNQNDYFCNFLNKKLDIFSLQIDCKDFKKRS